MTVAEFHQEGAKRELFLVCFMGVITIAEAAEEARNGLSAVGCKSVGLLLRTFGLCRADQVTTEKNGVEWLQKG